MITFLISKLTGLGLSEKLAKVVLIASAVAVISVGCVGLKACYDHRIISRHDDKVNIQVLQKVAPANDTAADARASDTIRLHEKAEERTNAIAKETDSAPSDADLALNCHRLRQSGQDTARIPACRGR